MKILPTLTTLAVVALAGCDAGTMAPQIEADDPPEAEVPALVNETERAVAYLVDQVIYVDGVPLTDFRVDGLVEAAAEAHDFIGRLIVDGDRWSVVLVQEIGGRTLLTVGNASSFVIDYGEPESSGVSR